MYLSRENTKKDGLLRAEDTRNLFSRLYKAGIVVEKVLTYSEQVGHSVHIPVCFTDSFMLSVILPSVDSSLPHFLKLCVIE